MESKRRGNPAPATLYYLECYPPRTGEEKELFTWRDACEVAKYHQTRHPEQQLLIREFDSI